MGTVCSGRTADPASLSAGQVITATATDSTKPHINRVPSPKQTLRGTWSSAMLGDWTAIWRHEGHTTTLQGVWLDPYTVVDANVRWLNDGPASSFEERRRAAQALIAVERELARLTPGSHADGL